MSSSDAALQPSSAPRLLHSLAAGLAGILAAALFLGVFDGGLPRPVHAEPALAAAPSAPGLCFHGPGGELLFGTQLGYGWGEMLAPNVYAAPSDWSVVKTQGFSVLFVLAGATNLRTIKRAIEGVRDAVTPGAQPARETPPAPR